MSTSAPSLEGLRMHAVQTAAHGVIDADTIFEFHQQGDRVWASYAGGRVERGYLVGRVTGAELTFRYCQCDLEGTLDGGHSRCEVTSAADGRVRIVEHFEWESKPGGGTNVIEEMRSAE